MLIEVGVGWQRRGKTRQSPRELDDKGIFFFLAVTMMVFELDHIVRGGEPYLRTRGMIVSRSANMVRGLRGSYIAVPITLMSLEWPHQKVK